MVGRQLVRVYMRTPPTHYYLESSWRAAYMETHPHSTYTDIVHPECTHKISGTKAVKSRNFEVIGVGSLEDGSRGFSRDLGFWV